MTETKYGTQEHYKEMFSDILADIACYNTVEENLDSIDNVLAGFINAIDEWLVYHNTACRSYAELRKRLLDDVYGTPEAIEREEAELPTIPPFPSLLDAKRVD